MTVHEQNDKTNSVKNHKTSQVEIGKAGGA